MPKLPAAALRSAALVLLAALFAACSSAWLNPPAPEADAPEDVRAFFRNPAFAKAALSPDGGHLAGVLTVDGLPVLVEKPLAEPGMQYLKKVTEHGMDVRTVGWAGEGHIVVGFDRPSQTLVDKTRRSRMLAIRLLRHRWRDGQSWIHPVEVGLADPVLHWLPEDPERILVHWWQPGGEGASVERVTVRSGVKQQVVSPRNGLHVYYADHAGQVRVGTGRDAEDGVERVHARRNAEGAFRSLPARGPDAPGELEFAGYAADPDRLYVRAYGDDGRKQILEFDLARWELGRAVYGHPDFDAGSLVSSPDDDRLLAVEVDGDRPELVFFDAAAERRQAAIDAAFPGTTNRLLRREGSGRHALLRVSGDTRPPELYLYDAETQAATFLFAELPDLEGAALAAMKPVRYRARDGREIPGYLTLPPAGPTRGLPVIVIPHDGPSRRVSWGWDPTVQFLAQRGFAVFQPNYRGSTGYGLDHFEAGRGEWYGAIQDDILDGVRFLVEAGIADPDRVGIYGRGFGGYSALLCAIREPGLFRAVASRGAITDLVDLRDHPDHFRTRETNLPLFGNLPRHERGLALASPARNADALRAPLLLAHGLEDPVVHPRQAQLMVDALEKAGARHETALYRGEPDSFVDEDSRIDFHHRLARFFETHLAVAEPL